MSKFFKVNKAAKEDWTILRRKADDTEDGKEYYYISGPKGIYEDDDGNTYKFDTREEALEEVEYLKAEHKYEDKIIKKKADEQNLEQQVYDKIDELDGILYEAITCCDKIEKMFSQLGIHSADIAPYMTNYLKNFRSGDRNVSVQDMFNRLEEYKNSKE